MKKIWIYQADRFFTPAEETKALTILQEFVRSWTAHGDQLVATAKIIHHLFVVLEVDESAATASGCSIDKSVRLLKEVEQALQIGLFDRLMVAYKDSAAQVQLVSRKVFQDLVKEGVVTPDTIVFNNAITAGEDFPTQWEVPFSKSWHANTFVI